jgi:exodeoxyribonuclease-5
MNSLSPQQSAALAAVQNWSGLHGAPVFRLFGYAGTGKTTLARQLVDQRVLFAAYTGKAAQVLRERGCPARTLHSLVMRPAGDSDRGSKGPCFVINQESDLRWARLLVVDEVSMVDRKLAEAVLSFGTKVLVLGDPAQLPPVEGGGYFTRAKPDVLLTEVHRQAAGSPIVDFATRVRRGQRLARQRLGESSAYGLMRYGRAGDFDQVIVGTNSARWGWNRRLRRMHNLSPDGPEPGDRVICLENNYRLGVFNGQPFEVVESGGDRLLLRDDSGEVRWLRTWPQAFEGAAGEDAVREMTWWKRQQRAWLTYGWAITCHKAQGSQWGSVLVVDESFIFSEPSRWLYTAITRATDRVAVMRPEDFRTGVRKRRPAGRRKVLA